MSQYVKSTAEGMHWSISVYKPSRGQAVAMATEGVREEPGEGRTFGSFTTRLFQDRFLKVELQGNNTKGNRQRALLELRQQMMEAKMIDADAPEFTG